MSLARPTAVRAARWWGGALVLLVAVSAPASPATAAPSKARTLTLFTVATTVQYLNNADDSNRGVINNPFDADQQKLVQSLASRGNTPLPGDVVVFNFKVYGSARLAKTIGRAYYTCYFNYDDNALCDANFELNGGRTTLVASGPIDFKTTRYSLVVTGGTNAYLAARGQLTERPFESRKAQRLAVELV